MITWLVISKKFLRNNVEGLIRSKFYVRGCQERWLGVGVGNITRIVVKEVIETSLPRICHPIPTFTLPGYHDKDYWSSHRTDSERHVVLQDVLSYFHPFPSFDFTKAFTRCRRLNTSLRKVVLFLRCYKSIHHFFWVTLNSFLVSHKGTNKSL